MVLGLSWPPVSYYVNLKLVFSKDLVHFIEIIRSICEELSVFLLSPVWGFCQWCLTPFLATDPTHGNISKPAQNVLLVAGVSTTMRHFSHV